MSDEESGGDIVNDPRKAAIKRIHAKRAFQTHLFVYVAVNAFLIGIWAISSRGYFWPIWVIIGWGFGLALNAWTVYFQKPVSEDDVQREMGTGSSAEQSDGKDE